MRARTYGPTYDFENNPNNRELVLDVARYFFECELFRRVEFALWKRFFGLFSDSEYQAQAA